MRNENAALWRIYQVGTLPNHLHEVSQQDQNIFVFPEESSESIGLLPFGFEGNVSLDSMFLKSHYLFLKWICRRFGGLTWVRHIL